MDKLVLNTHREGYSFDQVSSTMTVGDLKAFLEDYDDETPLYLSFDNGYTYGGVNDHRFELVEDEDEEC